MNGKTCCRLAIAAMSIVSAPLLVSALTAQTSPPPFRVTVPLGLDANIPVPKDNPLTPEKIALGKRLFSDPILSHDRSLACATCHDPHRAFTDDKPVAVGIGGAKGTRRVPTLINRAYGSEFFWDGRAGSLEQQVVEPIKNPKELGSSLEEVVNRLNEDPNYRQLFADAFHHDPNAADLARALASYLRTILAGDSPVDRFLNGDKTALSDEARRGLELFKGKANCSACHSGPNFSDEKFHNTGVAFRDGAQRDGGRFAVSGRDLDLGAFKTPTLREVARTAPYMHDGSMNTLEEVVDFYNRGGNGNGWLDPEMHPLRLTDQEKRELVAFLKSLNGEVKEGAD